MSDIFQNDLKSRANVPSKQSKNVQITTANQLIKAAETRIRDFRVGLRIRDEQQAIRRYQWLNLPPEIPAQLLERILYYKGQAAMFKLNDKFFFLPYTFGGPSGLDVYGRYNNITPVVFNGSAATDEDAKPLFKGKFFKVVKDTSEDDISDPDKYAVILNDYTPQLSQYIIPRYKVQDTLINGMSEQIVLSRSAILASMPADTLLVQDQGQADSVRAEIAATEAAIIMGMRIIPITSPLNTNPLHSRSGTTNIVSETWLNYSALDSIRLSGLGIMDKAAFDKKGQKLSTEAEDETINIEYIYKDGLECRREWAEIVNKLWGTNITVDESEIKQEAEEEIKDEQQMDEDGNQYEYDSMELTEVVDNE